MALFRFHRHTLEQSLKTTVIVEDKMALRDVILEDIKGWGGIDFPVEDLLIQVYGFDSRTGWYTQIVSFQSDINPNFGVIGYLSEKI